MHRRIGEARLLTRCHVLQELHGMHQSSGSVSRSVSITLAEYGRRDFLGRTPLHVAAVNAMLKFVELSAI